MTAGSLITATVQKFEAFLKSNRLRRTTASQPNPEQTCRRRHTIAHAADFLRYLDQRPCFAPGVGGNDLPYSSGGNSTPNVESAKRHTTPECARSLPAGKHIAQQHYGVVDRLRSEFILDHAADRCVDVFEP